MAKLWLVYDFFTHDRTGSVASSLIQTLSYSFEAGIVESLISHNEGLIGDAGQARARYRIEPPENSFFGIFTYPFIAFFNIN